MPSARDRLANLSIWWFAFGYFAAYAPYSALTKAISDGLLPDSRGVGMSGFELLPITILASLVGMFIFLSAMGWWKFAGTREVLGRRIPWPGRWTFLSGLCTAAIIGTTTLAYTFSGTSIVFMMLLMRGGLLVIAPVVDALSRRKVRLISWIALALSLAALLVAFGSKASFGLTFAAGLDVIVYLASYLVRLRFMSHLAKSDDPDARMRYFVEEQLVSTPAAVLGLAAVALFGPALGDIGVEVRQGFTSFFRSGLVAEAIVVGLLSQGTGIFGGLILLDKRENSFCVPVNRASSVLAGIVASFGLFVLYDKGFPGSGELMGAALIIAAIFVLAIPSLMKRRGAPVAESIRPGVEPPAVRRAG